MHWGVQVTNKVISAPSINSSRLTMCCGISGMQRLAAPVHCNITPVALNTSVRLRHCRRLNTGQLAPPAMQPLQLADLPMLISRCMHRPTDLRVCRRGTLLRPVCILQVGCSATELGGRVSAPGGSWQLRSAVARHQPDLSKVTGRRRCSLLCCLTAHYCSCCRRCCCRSCR